MRRRADSTKLSICEYLAKFVGYCTLVWANWTFKLWTNIPYCLVHWLCPPCAGRLFLLPRDGAEPSSHERQSSLASQPLGRPDSHFWIMDLAFKVSYPRHKRGKSSHEKGHFGAIQMYILYFSASLKRSSHGWPPPGSTASCWAWPPSTRSPCTRASPSSGCSSQPPKSWSGSPPSGSSGKVWKIDFHVQINVVLFWKLDWWFICLY